MNILPEKVSPSYIYINGIAILCIISIRLKPENKVTRQTMDNMWYIQGV